MSPFLAFNALRQEYLALTPALPAAFLPCVQPHTGPVSRLPLAGRSGCDRLKQTHLLNSRDVDDALEQRLYMSTLYLAPVGRWAYRSCCPLSQRAHSGAAAISPVPPALDGRWLSFVFSSKITQPDYAPGWFNGTHHRKSAKLAIRRSSSCAFSCSWGSWGWQGDPQ